MSSEDYNPLTDPSWPKLGATPLGTSPLPKTASGPSHSLLAYARQPTGVATGQNAGGLLNVNPRANVEGLNPEFRQRLSVLQQAAKAAGIDSSVLSGYRDVGLQAKLRANYEARSTGKALPYPEEGSGGIAAKPGSSYHNYGLAADVYATDPKQQQWLIDNAPKYGLYPGAKFGDPGHFQMDGPLPATMPSGPTTMPSGPATKPTMATGASPSPQPQGAGPDMKALGASVAGGPMPQVAGGPIQGLMTLDALQKLFPQHSFTPVDYNPFAVMPKVGASG